MLFAMALADSIFGTRDTLGFDLEIGNAADVDVPKKYVYEYPPQDLEEI